MEPLEAQQLVNYLREGEYPDGYSKNDKRQLRNKAISQSKTIICIIWRPRKRKMALSWANGHWWLLVPMVSRSIIGSNGLTERFNQTLVTKHYYVIITFYWLLQIFIEMVVLIDFLNCFFKLCRFKKDNWKSKWSFCSTFFQYFCYSNLFNGGIKVRKGGWKFAGRSRVRGDERRHRSILKVHRERTRKIR